MKLNPTLILLLVMLLLPQAVFSKNKKAGGKNKAAGKGKNWKSEEDHKYDALVTQIKRDSHKIRGSHCEEIEDD